MKIELISEPELEFGGARRNIDIRMGLILHGPLDAGEGKPRRIRLGLVGTQEAADGILSWLEKCRSGIEAKKSRQPNLFIGFPGFGADSPFRAEFEIDASLVRIISPREVVRIAAQSHYGMIADGEKLLAGEVQAISEHGRPDVVIVAVPEEFVSREEDEAADSIAEYQDEEGQAAFEGKLDLRDMLKAAAMRMNQPIQLVLPQTYNGPPKRRAGNSTGTRRLQDEATRAWNFHTALYYKANYRPWRLVRDPSDLHACFVGISFYRSLQEPTLMTSMAQVYDERGEGVIVRGKPVELAKDDRRPHLSTEDSFALLCNALREYRREHRHPPARAVLHKSSSYNSGELEGFNAAVAEHHLDAADFLIVSKSLTRLYRNGKYPPLRGTYLSLDQRTQLLYTRGSVPYYGTYPGMYVPRPLKIQIPQADESPRRLAEEILALTKLNWNNTQFDGGEPITMRVARQVGRVLKYVGDNGVVQPKYSFYM